MIRSEMIYLALIVLIATAFLAPALRPGYSLLPLQWISRLLPWSTYIDEPLQNRTLGDPFFAFYPRRLFFFESVRSGEPPFWNPYILGGYPAVGDTNAQTFYPFNWLATFLFSPARSFSMLAWFHLSLTGMLMFAMLRSYTLHSASSLLGAISWMLGGILIVWLEHPHRLSSFTWLPALFWLFNLGDREHRLAFPVLGGVVFSLMILGGQLQYAALAGLLLGVYAIFRSVKVTGGRLRWEWWSLLSLAIVTFVGLGLGSLQLLPAYEFVAQSHRAPRSMALWLSSALPPHHLTTFWLPNLFGSSGVGAYQFWGQKMNYVEYTFYFGALPFLLSIMAPLLSRRRRTAWLWSAVVALTILVALGTPLVHLARWIPGMTYFSLHRMMSHIPFLGSWLAALALDGIVSRSESPCLLHWGLPIASGGLLVVTGVVLYTCRLEVQAHWEGVVPELLRQGSVLTAGIIGLAELRRWRQGGLLLVLLITAADLFLWGRTFNPVSKLDLLYPENAVTDWLLQDASLYRVLPLERGQRIFGENVLSAFHIGTPNGYLALTLRHHKELMYTIDPYFADEARRFEGPHPNLIVAQDFHPLHSILNVKYVLSNVPLEATRLRHAATFHDVFIYENLDALPRAYVIHRADVVPEGDGLDAIVSPGWDFRTRVLISEPLTPEQQEALDSSPIQDNSHVRITQYTFQRVQLTADMEHAGLLVLTDPFYPGWHATVDGRPAEIMRVNHALRALFLEAGKHNVEFTFYPRSLITGACIVVATGVVGLVLIGLGLRWPKLQAERTS